MLYLAKSSEATLLFDHTESYYFMKKKISTDQNRSNIEEVLVLLRETPARLDRLSSRMTDKQLHEPIGPGERTCTEVLAHIINCEAISSESIYLALLRNEPIVP